ncbi:MAG: carboxypeptidase regulatory-like domain-containing protein, partial [Candidatus Cloacimonetes bacterium]|nr:carboxypeptidase regulatory-like domain-containing protein [Candidatus Cloacimonadota bacterium]
MEPAYFTNEEIITYLNQAEASYPDLAKVEIIGYSHQIGMPIYALKISDNVTVDEDEPELLFIGEIHAEEVLGTAGVMRLIDRILTNQQTYGQFIAQEELWFIPTLNPEGMEVVMDGRDTSYRKNQHDVNNNGVLDYSPAVGYDIDGVDLNRNFPFNWVHGDTLMTPGGYEVYDYYRGEAPLSESETIAYNQFIADHNFVYSIQWHTSRSGNFSEKCYYSYDWYGFRPSPDLDVAAELGNGVCDQIRKFDNSGFYERYASAGRNGSQHDYLYSEYQLYQLLIECGTENHQPWEPDLTSITNELIDGMLWIMKRALSFHLDTPSNSSFTGIVTDASNGEPLEGVGVYIEGRERPWLKPRRTDQYGRFWRPILSGTYTYRVEKEGYETATGTVSVTPNTWAVRNVQLQPATPITLTANISYDDQPLNADMAILEPKQQVVQSQNGTAVFNGFAGNYKLVFSFDGFYPCEIVLPITHDETVNVVLNPTDVLFEETWENGDDAWAKDNAWIVVDDIGYDRSAITTGWDGGYNFYPANQYIKLTTVNPIIIPNDTNAMLEFMQSLYTEWDYDPVTVEVSTNNEDFTVISTQSGRYDQWHKKYVDLSDYAGQSIYLRFALTDVSEDVRLVDPGWTLDNIIVYTGTSSYVANDETVIPAVSGNKLKQNYPNPFNPETIISFSLDKSGTRSASIDIYNILGQLVKSFPLSQNDMHRGSIVWHADNSASGVYFYRLSVNGEQVETRKALLIK